MKKISVIFAAVLLAVFSVCSVFAEGINSNEQHVLDKLKLSVKMQGVAMYWSAEVLNQARSYFNDMIEMTDEEADQLILMYAEAKEQLESSGAKNIADCTDDQKEELLTTLQKIMAVFGGTATYDKSTEEVILRDKDGQVVIKAIPTLVANYALLGVNAIGQKADSEVVKTTGASVDTTLLIVVGAVVVLAIAGVVFFVVKKRA